jgi:hypothetical protein
VVAKQRRAAAARALARMPDADGRLDASGGAKQLARARDATHAAAMP